MYSLTHFCSSWDRRHKAGFLKGPEAQEATLHTCYSAWLTDQASAHRSCDSLVTINPHLTVPSSWNRELHEVPGFNNKRLVCGKNNYFFIPFLVCKLVLVIPGLIIGPDHAAVRICFEITNLLYTQYTCVVVHTAEQERFFSLFPENHLFPREKYCKCTVKVTVVWFEYRLKTIRRVTDTFTKTKLRP